MRLVESACAVLIGTELLTGKVQDQNLHPLCLALRGLGIELGRVSIVPDDLPLLVRELSLLQAQYDLVVTSGGVGPTHDDLTMEAVARAHGVPLRSDPKLETLLQRFYGERLTETHLRMALVPDGATVLLGGESAWPTVVVGKTWVLPGVPELFRAKLADLRGQVRGPTEFHSRALYTRLDEGDLKPLLDRVVALHPEVTLGSYPKWFDPSYKTKLTLDSRSLPDLEAALRALLQQLPPGEPQRLE